MDSFDVILNGFLGGLFGVLSDFLNALFGWLSALFGGVNLSL